MINRWIERRVAGQLHRNRKIEPVQVNRARRILFSVFSRYGDGIIAFKIVREFIARYPDKTYHLVTSHQLRPYAEALLGHQVTILSVRKRNPFQLLRTVAELKKADFDLGFNPWGSRGDSEFFLTFAQGFFIFNSLKFRRTDNLYYRIRHYLGLPPPEAEKPVSALPQRVRRIVVCPFSTDIRKSLGPAEVTALLAWLKHKFPEARATLCLTPGEERKAGRSLSADYFLFGKSEARSRQFLHLVQESDLFVGVDAGPLHLADALGKPGFGLFGPTAPETVLDAASHILPLRVTQLKGIFCAVRSCPEPYCLQALFQDDPEKHRCPPSPRLEEEQSVCRFSIQAGKTP